MKFCLLTPFSSHNLQGRCIILLGVTSKNLTEPWSCLFVLVPSLEKDLELLAPVIWDHLVVSEMCDHPKSVWFFLPDFFFCCQLYHRVPGAIFRRHVNHNFSSYHQYFNFILCPLLLPPVSDMAAQGPWWRQGTVGDTYAYLSAEIMDLSKSAVGDYSTC